MLKPYTTLSRRGEAETVVNKSRFLAVAAPVSCEEEALAVLAERRALYKDASHHCYAYMIGSNMGIMRYSDDGEPGGTAGMPILDVLRAKEATDAVAVVTRYFGGILLGAGGLVRAYSGACAAAVAEAGTARMTPTAWVCAEVAYALLGRVERCLETQPVQGIEKTFAEAVTVAYQVRTDDEESVAAALTNACDGKIDIVHMDEGVTRWSFT